MRVLQINSVCGIRSTGRICTDIANTLELKGHECKVAYGRECVTENYKKYAVRIGNEFDVKIHALQTRIFDNTGFASKNVTKRFVKWIKLYDPDIIHLHNLHGYYINLDVLFHYLKKSNKPIIWTLHDCWAFTGHCAHFDFVGCQKWLMDDCANCLYKKNYPSSYLYNNSKKNYIRKKALFTNVDNMKIVTPSKWMAGLVKKSFLGCYSVDVINNGIDTDKFKPIESDFHKRYGLENKKIILGVASVWSEKKGLSDFVKLSKLINKDYVIVLVGLTQKQCDALPDNIIGLTRTNNINELVEIYSAADVFVNPTYEDNYPTVNLEAQACGTPVITYETGGSVESVPRDYIVTQGDINALCKKINEINFDNKKICDSKLFSGVDRYNEYIELYESILKTTN